MFWKSQASILPLDKPTSSSNYLYSLLRFRRTWSIKVFVLIWLSVVGIWLYRLSNNIELEELLTGQDEIFKELKLANYNPLFGDYLKNLIPAPHENFNATKYLIHSESYEPLFKKYGLTNILSDLTFTERCDLYFNELITENPKWTLDPNRKYAKDIEQLKGFTEFRMDHILYDSREMGIDPADLHFSEAKEEEIRTKFVKLYKKMRNQEQMVHTDLTHFKVFNKCYLTGGSPRVRSKSKEFVKEQRKALRSMGLEPTREASIIDSTQRLNFSSCSELEKRVYPWLTGKLPKYMRWDGTTYNGEIPQMCKYTNQPCKSRVREDPIDSQLVGGQSCFLSTFRQQLNGKGIALTIDDRFVDNTIRLIRLLRYQGNTVPIQIVYVKWVSEESRNQLIRGSREPLLDEDGNPLVEQELWFVDVSECLHPKYYKKFRSFGNKILATIFNSFSDLMLLDSDTVMMKPPEYFFNMPQYKKYGAHFFKDRSAQHRTKTDAMFFRKMMPSMIDSAIFDFPQVTNYTLDRELFDGLVHYVESGLVILNRDRHFLQALTMAQISFMNPISKRVHGDKELFLLSLTILGDESYSFNKHFAATIGVETPLEERVREATLKVNKWQKTPDRKTPKEGYSKSQFKSKEICSNHPAHINDVDDHTLLWINSGFRYCGQARLANYKKEFKHKVRYFQTDSIEKMKKLFHDQLVIKEAIIPPFDKRLGLQAKNDELEPEVAWYNIGEYCNGYTWCGYSSIGGDFEDYQKQLFKNTFQSGTVVQFTNEEIEGFNKLGKVWMSDFDFRSEQQIYREKVEKIVSKIKKYGFIIMVAFLIYKIVVTIYTHRKFLSESATYTCKVIRESIKRIHEAEWRKHFSSLKDYCLEKITGFLNSYRSAQQKREIKP